ncbi:MAG: signal peptidase I [Treponema sp.]|nr:signal peptidase I [Treponema sp.]
MNNYNKKKTSLKTTNSSKTVSSFKFFLLSELVVSVLFTLCSISFHADISLLAFPIALIFSGFFVYFSFIKVYLKGQQKYFWYCLKFIQYVPTVFILTFIVQRSGKYGMPKILDIISAILWILVFVFSFVLQYYMSDKRNEKLSEMWREKADKKRKPIGLKRVLYELIDWIDALLQVVFLVFIVQIFTFQLYVIPSESMVPEFLVKDRVVVEKIGSGPKFPLTDTGLPTFTKYKRGDIVVLRNPHYTMDRNAEVKTVSSQLVYMLTFMAVNLNKDDYGEVKADPLVKRIVGLEGEQLVMQDGILYKRNKNNDVFTPIPDKEDYASWNLNSVKPNVKKGVKVFPLSQNDYDRMLDFEEERRNFDLEAAAFRVTECVNSIRKLDAEGYLTDYENLDSVLGTLSSWIPSKNNLRDIYQESNYRINVMYKCTFAEYILRKAELNKSGLTQALWKSDKGLLDLENKLETIQWYINILDMRNMPVFPANDENGNPVYIPEGCYFMMGDNRFNSLDLRHRYEEIEVPLTKDDPESIKYYSIMEPQYLHKKYILGKPIFRFWPASRMGKLSKK